jgi:hypothetical protein
MVVTTAVAASSRTPHCARWARWSSARWRRTDGANIGSPASRTAWAAAGYDNARGDLAAHADGGRDVLVASQISERDLVAKPVDVTARAQPLAVRATEVPPGALEARALSVPTAATLK